MRLLLDPFLCTGPGSALHTRTLFEIAQRCARLGISLCVERQAWQDALRDPDVRRRNVDLARFEPLVKLDPLPVPSPCGAAERFVPARSETDIVDLRLLGALHARTVQCLIALDGRLHRLAAGAGLAGRLLTPADALHWLATLEGSIPPVVVRELDPRAALGAPRLVALLERECEPYDPYLRDRLDAAKARVLAVLDDGEPVACGVLASGANGTSLELVALAVAEHACGRQVLDPIVAAALGIARTRNVPVEALLPRHDELAALWLEQAGFQPAGDDAHGRRRLRHEAAAWVSEPAPGARAWWLPLDAAAHDRLLPELAGAAQPRLFAVGGEAPMRTLASAPAKQLLLPAGRPLPVAGDLLLFFHGRTPHRPASASLTAVARVDRTTACTRLDEVLAVNAARPCATLAEIRAQFASGPLAALDVTMLGRLERMLSLPQLRQRGILSSAPRAPGPVPAAGWAALSGNLALG